MYGCPGYFADLNAAGGAAGAVGGGLASQAGGPDGMTQDWSTNVVSGRRSNSSAACQGPAAWQRLCLLGDGATNRAGLGELCRCQERDAAIWSKLHANYLPL